MVYLLEISTNTVLLTIYFEAKQWDQTARPRNPFWLIFPIVNSKEIQSTVQPTE